MPLLKCPAQLIITRDAHKSWMIILEEAQKLVQDDSDLQQKAAQNIWIKERRVPPEVIGRLYTQYCVLINKMYDAYLNSVHLQRAPYIQEILRILMKRLYELRNELVHLIVNDYIYVDQALIQTGKTPFDIQIVIPYHVPLECRKDSMESMLQKMWVEAWQRKNVPPKLDTSRQSSENEVMLANVIYSDQQIEKSVSSEHIELPEEFIQAQYIQKQERFRQFFVSDFKSKCNRRRLYYSDKSTEAPVHIRRRASRMIRVIYRKYMTMKRQRQVDNKRDILLGIVPDPFKERWNFEEENNKMYERKRNIRKKLEETYMEQLEREKTRLVMLNRDNQIEDITDQVRSWFREWYVGYGFFPDYPYQLEGGTVVVIRGDYPTIDEKKELDERFLASTKGKTKEQLKLEKKQAKHDEKMKEEARKEQERKDAEQLFKLRCNPLSDPGYKPRISNVTNDVVKTLQKYYAAWSIFDNFPPSIPETLFGYIEEILTEDIMNKMHLECRMIVDELMRLELKLLVKAQQQMFKRVGWTFPKLATRKKPPALPRPQKPLKIDHNIMQEIEELFDLELFSKPVSKLKDIHGDYKYAAYELNITDPIAKFPPPSYGDVKRRLTLSCVYGMGIEPGAPRTRSVMLLGPQRNGKSFLVDAVAGEINAVKIDISPEVFSAKTDKPAKLLSTVLIAARLFQPTIIFMKNIERVFRSKVPAEEKYLMANTMKVPLAKLMKLISEEDKIMFIATCTNPFSAQAKPMVGLFNEIILVPRTDYNSLRAFFYEQFQRIRSMPRDYCVQHLAQVLQGFGFGAIVEIFNRVMSAERIVRLNVTPLSSVEFLAPLVDLGTETTTLQDYQLYTNFFIENSSLAKERREYDIINQTRALFYEKMEKLKKDAKK